MNATRINGDGTDPRDVTRAEMQGREDAQTMFEWLNDNLEEFQEAIVVTSGPVVGVTVTRRITGQSVIAREDILERKGAPDPVVLGAWYLDRDPTGKSGYHVHEVVRPYEIGYSTMVPRMVDNLMVAGRCHSADSPALASTRANGTALGMGQAAGTEAALAASAGSDMPTVELDVPLLQRTLMEDGAIILEHALARGDALGDRIPGRSSVRERKGAGERSPLPEIASRPCSCRSRPGTSTPCLGSRRSRAPCSARRPSPACPETLPAPPGAP